MNRRSCSVDDHQTITFSQKFASCGSSLVLCGNSYQTPAGSQITHPPPLPAAPVTSARTGDGCDAVDDRGDVLRRAQYRPTQTAEILFASSLNRSGPQRRPNRRVDVPAANRRALQ
eukprot:1979427-Prymnesium_polylepis.1